MKLTNTQIMQLNQAIRWFDGTTKPVLDAKGQLVGQDTVIPTVPSKVTYALYRTAAALAIHLDVVEKTRKAILTRANGGKLGDIGPDHKNHKQVMADLEKLAAETVELTLHAFDPDLLDGCIPSIPPSVMQQLMPILADAAPAKP